MCSGLYLEPRKFKSHHTSPCVCSGTDTCHGDIKEQLQAAGIGLREFQSKLSISLDFGQIRILLAHISRQGVLESAQEAPQ